MVSLKLKFRLYINSIYQLLFFKNLYTNWRGLIDEMYRLNSNLFLKIIEVFLYIFSTINRTIVELFTFEVSCRDRTIATNIETPSSTLLLWIFLRSNNCESG